jgi:drug/metabolite transporter (DMT)-like permease
VFDVPIFGRDRRQGASSMATVLVALTSATADHAASAPSGVTGGVLGITLVAAVLHAVWNAMTHGVSDRLVGFALIGVAYTVIGGAAALVLRPPPPAAWPFVLTSALLHVIYTLLLWASYQLGDFSQVYPVARGTAPLVVAAIEVALGHVLPARQLVGIAVISLGLISLALDGGRLTRAALPALGAAGATGICIAGYTVIDAGAVRATPVLVYAAWMFLLQGPVMPLIALLRRGRGLSIPARVTCAGLGGGVVSLAAYGLVLVAQTSGATAAVASLRETSIVFGAVIGTVFFGERFGVGRVIAAAVVALGIAVVNG